MLVLKEEKNLILLGIINFVFYSMHLNKLLELDFKQRTEYL